MLYTVATPIGNLADITFRAVQVLKDVDVILAEDTRQTKKLCNEYEISTPLESFHAHSSPARVASVIERLEQGTTMALVSDAGTPGICDPGFVLVKKCVEHNITVSPIPGANAGTACVSVSGFPMHNYLFLGFLPTKKGRKTLFEQMVACQYTIVFYESVHRVEKTLRQLAEYGMSDRELCIGREITKKFETFYRGTVHELLQNKLALKGEFCFVLAPSGFSLTATDNLA